MKEDFDVACTNCSEEYTVISPEKPLVCCLCGSADIEIDDEE